MILSELYLRYSFYFPLFKGGEFMDGYPAINFVDGLLFVNSVFLEGGNENEKRRSKNNSRK